jgi:hypothetical protein
MYSGGAPTNVPNSASPEKQVDAGDELQETGHPDAPHAGGEVNFLAALGKAEQLLRAVDHVAGAETEEPQG